MVAGTAATRRSRATEWLIVCRSLVRAVFTKREAPFTVLDLLDDEEPDLRPRHLTLVVTRIGTPV